MLIGNRNFDINKTHVMGILNVTPDSFSDGGRFVTMDTLLAHAEEMVEQGVDIIDIGGESTRPGYTMISSEEEISRVVPAIEAIKTRFDVPMSVDTYKADVAEAAICAGAAMVNDIWGLMYNQKMASVVERYDVTCVITHNKKKIEYSDIILDVKNELEDMANNALRENISRDKIILDVGLGFAKTTEHNLRIMKHLREFRELGYPVLLGASKKSFIGNSLDLPVHQRTEATLLTTAMACQAGCMFVRVHDVKENRRVIDMYNKIMEV